MTAADAAPSAEALTARDVRARTAVRAAVGSARRWAGRAQAQIGWGYWAVMGLAAVVVPLVARAVDDTAKLSVMAGVAYSARWVVFSTTIAFVIPLLGMHLATGGTRRSMHRGLVQALVVTGVAYGAVYGLALVAERAYVEAVGLRWSLPGGLGTFAGGVGPTALGEVFAISVYALVGATFTALFQAGQWSVRTVAAGVLTAAFLPAVELVTRSGTAGDAATTWLVERVGLDGPAAVVVGLLLAAGLTVALAAWYWHRLSNTQLRPPW